MKPFSTIMRKCLLFIVLLAVSLPCIVKAQSLIIGPNATDTVCVRQPINLSTSDSNASSFYWGFCSGYMLHATPDASNLGNSYGFKNASNIDIVKDGDSFYGFVVNHRTTELLELQFGTSLSNPPTILNLGNMEGKLPPNPNSLYITQSAGNWFIFVSGGISQASSTLARVDFRNTFANTPNIVNFGNLGNIMNTPTGLFVDSEASSWYVFFLNNGTNELMRYDIGTNISYTPFASVNLGNQGGFFKNATDMAAMYEGGNWYFFVTDASNNSITRIDMGPSVTNTSPSAIDVTPGLPTGILKSPTGISLLRDCGSDYAYITNFSGNNLIQISFPVATGPYTALDYGTGLGALNSPADISRFIRDKDNLYAYVVNDTDNTLSQFVFRQCTNSTLLSSNLKKPPVYKYLKPGTYNVYFEANTGLPTMVADCKQIYVENLPNLIMTHDTTICEHDTIYMEAVAPGALSYTWSPSYHSSISFGQSRHVWPDYSVSYGVVIPFPDGCIIDTFIQVNVSKVKADAGPDRFLSDGSKTVLGGPLTSYNISYKYRWSPPRYITDTTVRDPTVNPPYDLTYYLEVTELNDTLGCKSRDTVVIHVQCDDFHLPNAFKPTSGNGETNRFGILNQQFIQINYFRIYDRWGELMFETTDPSKTWDGTIGGKDAPMGVYVWEADGYCASGTRFKRSGNVTLIR